MDQLTADNNIFTANLIPGLLLTQHYKLSEKDFKPCLILLPAKTLLMDSAHHTQRLPESVLLFKQIFSKELRKGLLSKKM